MNEQTPEQTPELEPAWTKVITKAGLRLQAAAFGKKPNITRVVMGSGSVPVEQLEDQTNVTDYVTDLSILSVAPDDTYTVIRARLINRGLTQPAPLVQLGIFAQLDEEPEVLIAISQTNLSPSIVPAETQGGYAFEPKLLIAFINVAGFTANIDWDAFASLDDIEDVKRQILTFSNEISAIEADITRIKAPKFGICTDAAPLVNKTVEIDGFEMFEGARVIVFFQNGNTADIPTLNVSNTGARQIWFRENPIDGDKILEGASIEFVAHGNHWDVVGDLNLSEIDEMSVVEALAGTETKARSVSSFTLAQLHETMFPGYAALVALVNSMQTQIDQLEYIVSHKLMDYQPAEEQQIAMTGADSVILITGEFDTDRIYI